MYVQSQVLSVFVLSLVMATVSAEEKVTPSRIVFLEADIRKLCKDGEKHKAESKEAEIVYVALGRKIREKGDQGNGPNLILAEKLGEGGIVFRKGYAEVNVGVYIKQKTRGNLAFYLTFKARVTISDNLTL